MLERDGSGQVLETEYVYSWGEWGQGACSNMPAVDLAPSQLLGAWKVLNKCFSLLFFRANAFSFCLLLVGLANKQAKRDSGKKTAREHLPKGFVPAVPRNSSVED